MTFGESLLLAASWLWSPVMVIIVVTALICLSAAVAGDRRYDGVSRGLAGVYAFLLSLFLVALMIWVGSNGIDPLSWEVTR